MSRNTINEPTPIIIKGKTCSGGELGRYCFDISCGQEFRVETEEGSDAQEWVKSTTVYKTGGIGSITIGENGPRNQYCKTSGFVRPLTLRFIAKTPEEDDHLLFTISEGNLNENNDCDITISVQDPDTYFKIMPKSLQGDDWEASEGGFSKPVAAIIISDSSTGGDTHCGCLLMLDEQINVNILPPNV
jgi:hypothetical protein